MADFVCCSNVLNLEVGQIHLFVAKFFQCLCKLLGCEVASCFRLCSSAYHFAIGENSGSCHCITISHEDSLKSLRIVLCIIPFEGKL